MDKVAYLKAGIGKRQYNPEVVRAAKDLYLAGQSTRQIALILGVSKSRVADWCADIFRNKSQANQLRQPPSSTHWRSSRQAARRKMERFLGRTLKTDEHVHHVNHDYTDNRLENLQVIDAREHGLLHAKAYQDSLRNPRL